MSSTTRPTTSKQATGLFAVVGFLVCVELASGVLQGFYTPIWNDVAAHLDIRPADVNWFEAAQLIVSALVVPLLARLGDVIGHKRVLLISTVVTAVGSWVLAFSPTFATFLVGFALQGAYVVWLPMEVAIVHRRTAGSARQAPLTRRAAAILVGALELAVVIAALTSGALVETVPLTLLLAVPAIVVTACVAVVWFGIEDAPGRSGGGVDLGGLGLVTVALGLVMAGLVVIRLAGPGQAAPWILLALGVVAVVPFVGYELHQREPLVDVRLLRSRAQWPVQLTAALVGVSVLGAAIPLSTFSRTDPVAAGYGLGASASFVSLLISVYVLALVVGAVLLPASSRVLGPRAALVVAVASSVFAIALAGTGPAGAAPLTGYLAVWTICALAAVAAAGVLLALPRVGAGAAQPRATRRPKRRRPIAG